MKTFLILLVLVCTSRAISVDAALDAKERIQFQIDNLQKTGWGKVAVNLLSLQLMTDGPLGELQTAFKNLIDDLNFKLNSEQEEYRWAKAEHFQLDKEINGRLTDAKVRFATASSHLDNTLYPEQRTLAETIANDNKLITETNNEIDQSTKERALAEDAYQASAVEHEDALEAVRECQALVRGLQEGGATLIQVKDAQKHLKDVSKKLTGMGVFVHMAKALVTLTQDFANKSATEKVYDLLVELEQNLVQSGFDLDAAN